MTHRDPSTAEDLPADEPRERSGRAASITGIDEVLALGAGEMARVDACIREALASDVLLINQVSNYIVAGGGKRLRPLLLALCARACGYEGQRHIPLAAIVEFIHTATLLHDDVVDESDVRRGRRSAHAVFGNPAAVLVGDFLYSRSFQMMVTIDSMRVMDILAATTNTIAEGEVLQLLNLGDPEVDEAAYLAVIDNKTAKLFEAACQLAAVVAEQDEAVERSLAEYGTRLGRAFQLADDLLDYDGDSGQLGKNVGDDLAEGKPTLPLILARARCTDDERRFIDAAVRGDETEDRDQVLNRVLGIIRRTGALASTRERARDEAAAALAALRVLPASRWRDALEALAEYSYHRRR